ncbi:MULTISPECIES: hypothetical protein [unclassified Vibrio]|uniref:Uncharacterized protein n=1 Tax=Vibrio sp. HB236076 TaxID=3232307 RepID=A0AB39HG77_9VIBR|nr:hypothetical protein [Vibrio sp. HB161653]MDP5253209.1 hypothetical protein [Vibrio sp. HB161653]
MTDLLFHHIQTLNINRASCFSHCHTDIERICSQYNELFSHTQQTKPELSINRILLGVLTKAQIDARSHVEATRDSRQSMSDVFQRHLSPSDASKFQDQSLSDFLLITQLWLYLQGWLHMDLSLAADHATSSAALIAPDSNHQSHHYRSLLMESYYTGKAHSPAIRPPKPWWQRLFRQ